MEMSSYQSGWYRGVKADFPSRNTEQYSGIFLCAGPHEEDCCRGSKRAAQRAGDKRLGPNTAGPHEEDCCRGSRPPENPEERRSV